MISDCPEIFPLVEVTACELVKFHEMQAADCVTQFLSALATPPPNVPAKSLVLLASILITVYPPVFGSPML